MADYEETPDPSHSFLHSNMLLFAGRAKPQTVRACALEIPDRRKDIFLSANTGSTRPDRK